MQDIDTEIVNKVLLCLNWTYKDTARKSHGSFTGWTKGELVELILIHSTGPNVAEAKGCGIQAFNRTVKDILWPILGSPHGGNETWKYLLLKNASLKECFNCNTIKDYDDFSTDVKNPDGKDRLCRVCKAVANKKFYQENKDTYHKPYIASHRSEYNARNAQRQASKTKQTPVWADLSKIKEIYKNCPEGMHVDHIVPLKGELVSGLHVESNLQYLSQEENLKKSNRFIIE